MRTVSQCGCSYPQLNSIQMEWSDDKCLLKEISNTCARCSMPMANEERKQMKKWGEYFEARTPRGTTIGRTDLQRRWSGLQQHRPIKSWLTRAQAHQEYELRWSRESSDLSRAILVWLARPGLEFIRAIGSLVRRPGGSQCGAQSPLPVKTCTSPSRGC